MFAWSSSGLESALQSASVPLEFLYEGSVEAMVESIEQAWNLDVRVLGQMIFASEDPSCRLSLVISGAVPGNKIHPKPSSISKFFSKGVGDSRTTILNGTDPGVAFFLNFSVHGLTPDHKKGEDTRILPVHYSDNYFSLVPGEATTVKLTFKVPPGVTPRGGPDRLESSPRRPHRLPLREALAG